MAFGKFKNNATVQYLINCTDSEYNDICTQNNIRKENEIKIKRALYELSSDIVGSDAIETSEIKEIYTHIENIISNYMERSLPNTNNNNNNSELIPSSAESYIKEERYKKQLIKNKCIELIPNIEFLLQYFDKQHVITKIKYECKKEMSKQGEHFMNSFSYDKRDSNGDY